ncbi:MAG: FAD-dependent oxidoreductase [Baekduiaceae bacterium]
MRREGEALPPGVRLHADVVVVGAGPLGIVTALELANRGHRVLLLESGLPTFDARIQRLSDSDSRGEDYYHVRKDLSVRRQLGGTSALWGGRCVPFDPIDFEARPAVPEELWPIGYDEMARYLPRACEWAVCGDAVFNARDLPEIADRDLVPGLPDGEVRTTDLERWSLPTRFGKEYREALDQHPLVDLITGVTCTRIVCTADGGSVDHLQLRTADGAPATASARRYVLATGGLEATRLLMASNDVHPEGIGNHSGHLGRWYMAHIEARVARVHFTAPADETIHSHERDADGVYVRRRFSLDQDLQRREAMPNGVAWIVNPELGDASHGSGILSGVYLTLKSPAGRFLLAEAIRQAHIKTSRPARVRDHVRNIVRDLVPAARFAVTFTYERFLRPGRKVPGFFIQSSANVYPLHYHGEHLPHWESRVELSDERDELGVPRLRTSMHVSEDDVRSVRAALDRIDAHLRRHGAGRIEYLTDDVEAAVHAYLGGIAGYHQTGTTRMSARPEDGVVDADLRVHGVTGLHIASTSVFPTSSQANPTLTGIAFAVRLAEHLDETLRDTRSAAPPAFASGA